MRDPFDPAAFSAALAAPVRALAACGSTNDEAKAWAREGAPHGAAVVADRQTGGRGRLGRRWEAEPGESLLCSWVVRVAWAPDRWPLLPLLAGVAAAEAVEALSGAPVALKWPNDLLLGERKLGGILVEAEPPAFAVVGLGVNLRQRAFEGALSETATSLAAAGYEPPARPALLAAVLAAFEGAVGAPGDALARYRRRCATLGRRVRVQRASGDLEGIARDVDETGALLVEDGDEVVAVAAGDVVHLRPA